MPRKKTELTEEMKINVKNVIETVMRENNIKSQLELAEKIYCPQEQISRMKNGHRAMSEDTANAIIKAFPEKNYPKEWLRGFTKYRTKMEEWRDQWEKDLQPYRDYHKIMQPVADMLKLCGVEWDGDTSIQYAISNGQLLPVAPINVQGVDFYPWDFRMIADKVFEQLQMELRYMIQSKKNEAKRSKPLQSSVLHSRSGSAPAGIV